VASPTHLPVRPFEFGGERWQLRGDRRDRSGSNGWLDGRERPLGHL